MLETMVERMNSYICNSISQIDTTVVMIETSIQRIIIECEAVGQLLDTFECNDVDTISLKNNSKIELLRNFIDKLIAEKEQLLTLLVNLEGLSETKRYPLKGLAMMPNELFVQVVCLEETANLVLSDIDNHMILLMEHLRVIFPRL